MSDRTRNRLRPVTWALLCAALSACAPTLQQVKPRSVQTQLPSSWGDTSDSTNAVDTSWSDFFADEDLAALIREALENNRELGILQQEVFISNAEILARRGEYLPSVGVGGYAGMEKVGLYTSQGASDASTEIEPGREVPEALGDLQLGFRASWEIDIWKRMRNATKAARLRYLASIDGRNFVVTQLVAEIASSWYELMALDAQLEVVDVNIGLMQEAFEGVKVQKEAARTTELGVQRIEAELLKNQARRFEIRQRIVETENRINFLCGRFPQPVARPKGTFATLSTGPVAPGMPTQLLENRPDVHAAELELEAAKLDVKSARALFYPSLAFDAELGLQAFSLQKLAKTPESLLWSAGAGLLAPLINRAEIRATYASANARQMAAVLAYEQTVLNAYREVANQLAMIENLGSAYELKQRQVDRLDEAIETSGNLFRSARADYLEVLTTRRDALESQMELIETKQMQLAAKVNAYQALGGAWRQPGANE